MYKFGCILKRMTRWYNYFLCNLLWAKHVTYAFSMLFVIFVAALYQIVHRVASHILQVMKCQLHLYNHHGCMHDKHAC